MDQYPAVLGTVQTQTAKTNRSEPQGAYSQSSNNKYLYYGSVQMPPMGLGSIVQGTVQKETIPALNLQSKDINGQKVGGVVTEYKEVDVVKN